MQIFNKDAGLIWFVKQSYSYVHPVGLIEHMKFIIELPGAAYRYCRLMTQ